MSPSNCRINKQIKIASCGNLSSGQKAQSSAALSAPGGTPFPGVPCRSNRHSIRHRQWTRKEAGNNNDKFDPLFHPFKCGPVIYYITYKYYSLLWLSLAKNRRSWQLTADQPFVHFAKYAHILYCQLIRKPGQYHGLKLIKFQRRIIAWLEGICQRKDASTHRSNLSKCLRFLISAWQMRLGANVNLADFCETPAPPGSELPPG